MFLKSAYDTFKIVLCAFLTTILVFLISFAGFFFLLTLRLIKTHQFEQQSICFNSILYTVRLIEFDVQTCDMCDKPHYQKFESSIIFHSEQYLKTADENYRGLYGSKNKHYY